MKLIFVFVLVKREEARKAQILFAIVIFFVICNVPRTVLNLEEFVVIAPSYWRNYKHLFHGLQYKEEHVLPLCYSPPFWAHILGSISKLLLTLNASVCCFVYCIMCQTFRAELSNQCQNVINFLRHHVFRVNIQIWILYFFGFYEINVWMLI